MPRVDSLYPTRFISAADLAKLPAGDRKFVIRDVVQEDCRNPKTQKVEQNWIVYFHGCQKGHRLRKSEVRGLGPALGEETEQWRGKTVTLRAASTRVGAGVRLIPSGTGHERQASGNASGDEDMGPGDEAADHGPAVSQTRQKVPEVRPDVRGRQSAQSHLPGMSSN